MSGFKQPVTAAQIIAAGGITSSSTAAGDLAGTYPNPTVAAISNDTTLAEGVDLVLGTVNGSRIGTGITQLLGVYGAAPIAQRAGVAQDAVATTGATLVTPAGYTTTAQANAIVTLVNELRAWAVAQGFIKGAA